PRCASAAARALPPSSKSAEFLINSWSRVLIPAPKRAKIIVIIGLAGGPFWVRPLERVIEGITKLAAGGKNCGKNYFC
ncbi:MAG: hypothetical protein MR393_10455, partial [Intestinimonas massiliensis]|uniref:hypothetical protein n=1 Tax=Intestinimonas massiliensis (ex Afouda et al. 2020) TaxID=1673721 RepID=UPI00242CFB79